VWQAHQLRYQNNRFRLDFLVLAVGAQAADENLAKLGASMYGRSSASRARRESAISPFSLFDDSIGTVYRAHSFEHHRLVALHETSFIQPKPGRHERVVIVNMNDEKVHGSERTQAHCAMRNRWRVSAGSRAFDISRSPRGLIAQSMIA
jgi:hypothetical protein